MPNFVEAFFGSGAVLLGRPHEPGIETVNDKDALICNFWRAVQHDPDAVTHYASWSVNESDLHARHIWLVNQLEDLVPKVEGDPDYYDAKIAGWWVWGISCWIGGEFCSGKGPWKSVDGKLIQVADEGHGVHRKRVHLTHTGQGVLQGTVQLGHAGHDNAGTGEAGLQAWMFALQDRLARVRVCCGDWTRVLGPTVTHKNGLTGVFLDPPYAHSERDQVYRIEGDISVHVRQWAIENGNNRLMRIVLCGYQGEHDMPKDWRCVEWKAPGGYANQGKGRGRENATRERLWLSPYCLEVEDERQLGLWD